MNIQLVLILALVAVVVALFAWALTASKNAKSFSRPTHQKGVRRHWRKVYLMPLLVDRMAWWFGFARRPRLGVQFANIGEGTFEHGLKSYIPDSGTTSRYLLYKIGSDNDHCVVCGAGDTPLGSSDDLADANNLDVAITIKLFGAMKGMTRVITDGTVANGNRVKAGAGGKVTVAVTGDPSFGIAVFGTDTSSANGDTITIIPCVCQKYAF